MSYSVEEVMPVAQPVRADTYRRRKLLESALETVGLLLTLFFIMTPIAWMALTAFKQRADVFTLKVFFTPTLQNFVTIFQPPLSFGPLLLNSIIIAMATVLISTPLALMAAYAFSRYRFVGNTSLMIWVLATQFIPQVVITIPFFNLFRTVGLVDTRTGLVILNLAVALPYAIWMIKGFVDGMPIELEEAALVDGCSEVGMLRRIVVPLVMPGVLVAAVFSFITAWNEFIFALIMTRTESARTLQVGLMSTVGAEGIRWDWMSATGMIVMVPIFILSLLIRKHFVQGLTMGAV
ncbi:MAG: carbohydrate ABC transporter permease, partial [Chloroflexota bacterium]|nr:carbohydrate ABC transporter permease [Chloroflexota bacterium]